MNIDIKPVILCGASGTRLWPLSRQSLPKQFVPMIDGKSLLELTLIEEIAFEKGFISKKQLIDLAKPLAKNQYGQYLLNRLEEVS